ncbi:MAG: ABC transporter substrate-binding protein [Pseudorhodoplanes sp.]|uniref:ABC transporter substrate-binding protein n=1 Tax=Pseudorhodoplanes sp. TaxID=1934341 RepID=UPI003D0FED2D
MNIKAIFTGVTLVATASMTSLSMAQPPGVTADKIKIGILGSLTGPAAIWGSSNLAGGELAFEQINAAGGIHGRKLEWVVVDDETSPPKAIAGFKKLNEQDQVFAIFGPAASAIGAALVPTMRAANVPVFMSVLSSPAVTDPVVKNVFRTGPLNDQKQGRAIANYVVGELKGKRIALLRQSDEYGSRGGSSVVKRMKELKVDPVAHEVFGPGDTDFTSQVLKIRETKPDVLIIYGYPSPSAIITRQARQLGVDAQIIGSNATSSRRYPEIVGKVAAGTLNVITNSELPESAEPKMAAFRKAFEARYPDLVKQVRPDLGDVLCYGGALTFIEALKRAGKDLTREKFIAALEALKDYNNGINLPTTFSATDHDGNNAARVMRIREDLTRELLPHILKAD